MYIIVIASLALSVVIAPRSWSTNVLVLKNGAGIKLVNVFADVNS
jgi:hypothetical protein